MADSNSTPKCECGCGIAVKPYPCNNPARGKRKGEFPRFTKGHQHRMRESHCNYRAAHSNGRVVGKHIAIAEAILGKRLPKGAQVHHVNGDKHDNCHSNLVVCPDYAYHALLHVRQEVIAAGGNPNTQRVCYSCNTVKDLSDFNVVRRNTTGRAFDCRRCSRIKAKAYLMTKRANQVGAHQP